MVTEVYESLLQKFKTEKDKNDHMEKLKYWEKEEC